MMKKKKTSETEELYGDLGQAFNFTYGDLEANRAGFLSFRQRKILPRYLLEEMRFVFSAAIVVAVVLVLLFMGNFDGMLLLIIPLLLVIPSSVLFISMFREIQKGRVESLMTGIQIDTRKAKRWGFYLFLASGKRFELSEAQAKFPYTSLPYKIYYVPNSRHILSIEVAVPE